MKQWAYVALICSTFAGALSLRAADTATLQTGGTNTLTLREFVQLVLQRNESLRARLLEYEISEKRTRGEQGIFEPELVLGYDRIDNERENTAEQRRSSGVQVFEEQNNVYNAGLEALVPSGAKVRLGYTLRDLRNNLQDPALGVIVTNGTRGEWQTFAGISLTQPVLKNAWLNATKASIRVAMLQSDVSFQEYRRQMMLVVSTAEAAYWNLYMAQEQVRFFHESVRVAESLVTDNQTKLDAGRGSELEVLEARAGLALRKSKQAEAEQKYFENVSQLRTLLAMSGEDAAALLQAADQPGIAVTTPPFYQSGQMALEQNPDYLAQLKKMKQEDVRVAYAKNQRLPQLDLKASYGLNGLGPDAGSSFEDVQEGGYPSWSIGAELRIPLIGGIKVKNDLAAAKLRKQQALVTLKDTETQILNAIQTALRKVSSAQESTSNYRSVVDYSTRLLETERTRLDAGRTTSRRVLEVDAAVFESKNAVVEAQVQYERALLELELVQGSLLQSRNLDLTQKEVRDRTTALLRAHGISEEQYQRFAQELQQRYEKRPTPNAKPPPPGRA
ncbi:MAG: TolC family protein [Verrucomicrobia bacterium]|nr:TolC family protein [Verrucomicrobiota bacterium]